jgi:hypothetical protein
MLYSFATVIEDNRLRYTTLASQRLIVLLPAISSFALDVSKQAGSLLLPRLPKEELQKAHHTRAYAAKCLNVTKTKTLS